MMPYPYVRSINKVYSKIILAIAKDCVRNSKQSWLFPD